MPGDARLFGFELGDVCLEGLRLGDAWPELVCWIIMAVPGISHAVVPPPSASACSIFFKYRLVALLLASSGLS
jgi:hypothetical protein